MAAVVAGLAGLISPASEIDGVLPLESVLAGETSIRLVYPHAGGSRFSQISGEIAADPGRKAEMYILFSKRPREAEHGGSCPRRCPCMQTDEGPVSMQTVRRTFKTSYLTLEV